MRIVELRPELYLLGFPIGQCYIWRDGDAVTLVDTGARGSGPAIAQALHARVASGLPPAPPARVDPELQDGDVLDVGGGAKVISTPGHTDGSIALHLPAPRVLFTGDTMAHFEGRVILGPFNLGGAQAMTSLRMLAELDVDVACFDHGDPIVGGASGPLRAAATALSEP